MYISVSLNYIKCIYKCKLYKCLLVQVSGIARGARGATAPLPPNGPQDRSREKSQSGEKFEGGGGGRCSDWQLAKTYQ